MIEMTDQDFLTLKAYIQKVCGIALGEEKKYLVQQRLEELAISNGARSFSEFCAKLYKEESFMLRDQVIAEITTTETFFFRDSYPFETFKDTLLPALGDTIRRRRFPTAGESRPSKVRIWSAAASTGQEPYSIAMLTYEYAINHRHKGIDPSFFEILATDISPKVLGKAVAGEYTEMEISRGLSKDYVEKFFEKKGDLYAVKPFIQNMIQFRRLNLTEHFTTLGSFDVIFCRNVLIYFDNETKKKILDQFARMLTDDGILLLGASETVSGLTDVFDRKVSGKTVMYSKKLQKPSGKNADI